MTYKLTEAESQAIITDRSQGKPAAERTGFIGIVNFHNGPRGGRYRGIRTACYTSLDRAVEEAEAIAARRWNVPVRGTDVVEVNCQGEVVG